MKFQIIFLVLCFAAAVLGEFKCTDGVSYIENNCNECGCSYGKLDCTRKLCHGKNSIQLRNCEVGSEWKDKCNDCVCDEAWKVVCTNNPC